MLKKDNVSAKRIILPLILIFSYGYADEQSELQVISILSQAFKNNININNSPSYAAFHNLNPNNTMEIEANMDGLDNIRSLYGNGQYKCFVDAVFYHRTANCGEYALLAGMVLKGLPQFESILAFTFEPGNHVFIIAKGVSQNFYLFDPWTNKSGKIHSSLFQRLHNEQNPTINCPINTITGRPLCVYPEIIFGTQDIYANPYVSANSHSVYNQQITQDINYLYDNGCGYNYVKQKLGL